MSPSTSRRLVLFVIAFVVTMAAPIAADEVDPAGEPAAQPAGPSAAGPTGTSAKDDDLPPWAANLLDADPLAAKEVVTLDDLEAGLADPAQRETLITRHFTRASLSPEQREAFLRRAFEHETAAVRRQAAVALARLGLLKRLIRERLRTELLHEDPLRRERAALAVGDLTFEVVDAALLEALVTALGSEDREIRDAAGRQLLAIGPAAVPILLEAAEASPAKPDTAAGDRRARAALRLLGRLAADRAKAEPPSAGPGDAALTDEPSVPSPPKSRPSGSTSRNVPRIAGDGTREVDVFFGTHRNLLPEAREPLAPLIILPTIGVLLLVLIVVVLRESLRATPDEAHPRHTVRTGTIVLLAAIGGLWAFASWNAALQRRFALHEGAKFGAHRDPEAIVRYGVCRVSLPPTHEVGRVERPRVGPESPDRHVVLQQTRVLDREQFLERVRAAVGAAEAAAGDCFVFVHGYNTSFEEAARRTAQIHLDLEFEGAPLFYSWPSRGTMTGYMADRNEVFDSKQHVREFLQLVADRVEAGKVHVIAHSMGGAIVSEAIAEIDPDRQRFDQIVLAAPDVDADVFRRRILPRFSGKASRTTLYCSQDDWALRTSRFFNDGARAGDSSVQVFVADQLDTIDASEMDTTLIGHSYYGDCLTMLRDVRLLFTENRPPPGRKLVPQVLEAPTERVYWTFPE